MCDYANTGSFRTWFRYFVLRSLFNQPQMLMADEPTSNLDEQTEQEIMELFQQVHASTG